MESVTETQRRSLHIMSTSTMNSHLVEFAVEIALAQFAMHWQQNFPLWQQLLHVVEFAFAAG